MVCLSDESSSFFPGGQGGCEEYFMHCKESNLCWIEEEKPRNPVVVRVPFSQRLVTSTCGVFLIRSAVLPMAVIHKNTLFLYTSFEPRNTMQFLLSFFHQSQTGWCFSLVNPPPFWLHAWLFPRCVERKEKKIRIISFCSWLIHGWREKGVVFGLKQNGVQF